MAEADIGMMQLQVKDHQKLPDVRKRQGRKEKEEFAIVSPGFQDLLEGIKTLDLQATWKAYGTVVKEMDFQTEWQ